MSELITCDCGCGKSDNKEHLVAGWFQLESIGLARTLSDDPRTLHFASYRCILRYIEGKLRVQ